jgi:hypothetical protein
MREPDYDKMSNISDRLDAESKKPGYSREVFQKYLAEAKEAVGDYPHLIEFLGPYMPKADAKPAPAKKTTLSSLAH